MEEGLCFNSETNKKVPGSHYKSTLRFPKRENCPPSASFFRAGRFAGTWTARTTYSELISCENTLGDPHGTYRWTVAR